MGGQRSLPEQRSKRKQRLHGMGQTTQPRHRRRTLPPNKMDVMAQTSLAAFYDLDRLHADQSIQKIIATLTLGGTDRSHIAQYTGINKDNVAWRLSELRAASLIKEEGECLSVSGRRATRWVLNV